MDVSIYIFSASIVNRPANLTFYEVAGLPEVIRCETSSRWLHNLPHKRKRSEYDGKRGVVNGCLHLNAL